MKFEERPMTLGQYLELGRRSVGLSYRQCASAANMPLTTAMRLFRDSVENPQADHVQRLVRVLELDDTDAFAYIGVTPPEGLPDTTPYLRAKYGLRGRALSEAAKEIQEIINKYDGIPSDK